MKKPFIIIGIAVLAAFTGTAQSPLPDDLALTAPGPDIATNIAVFAGAWHGSWGGSLPTALVIEKINTNGTAQAIYSWGEGPVMHIKAGWTRVTGDISPGKLHLQLRPGTTVDFTVQPDGKLWAIHQSGGIVSDGELTRISSSDPAQIIAAAKTSYTPWKEITIPVHSQVGPTAGQTFKLQTTIYPFDTPGKHPVVILSHGSTGPGILPVTQVYRGGAEEMLFHSLGYIEVVPMRKGRGASEGPNVEENFLLPSETTLDSAVEDLHAVIEYLGTLPEVDTNHIVLAGASRGGFLSAVYAGRYPAGISGVLNFSGGWFGEGTGSLADFNFQEFKQAGKNARVPMLWLYGDHDSFYSLKFDEKEFADFKSAGGTGDLVEVHDLPGDGHALLRWMDRWQGAVTNYLAKIGVTAK